MAEAKLKHTYENKIPPRDGKTKNDHKSGAWARRFANRDQRVSWQKDKNASVSNFPYTTCNGKDNRTLVTGKGNQVLTYTYK